MSVYTRHRNSPLTNWSITRACYHNTLPPPRLVFWLATVYGRKRSSSQSSGVGLSGYKGPRNQPLWEDCVFTLCPIFSPWPSCVSCIVYMGCLGFFSATDSVGKKHLPCKYEDLPVSESQGLGSKQNTRTTKTDMATCTCNLTVGNGEDVWSPGGPWPANLAKMASFRFTENLSEGNKVGNSRRQSSASSMCSHRCVYLHNQVHGTHMGWGRREGGNIYRYIGFSLGHTEDLGGCRERVVTRGAISPGSQRMVAETSKSACAILRCRFWDHFVI